MSLSLPANFAVDIQSKDTSIYPFVLIDDTGMNIRLSTNAITIGANFHKPLLLNIPSLKESIDIEKRNYKISSVTLDISNYEYEGVRFSDLVGDASLINMGVQIFWGSQSTTDYVSAFQVYNGTIRRYTHDDEKVRLVVEDRSQATLHKDLPLPDNYLTGDIILDRYKNRPVPMVYGHVDRSPCVIDTSGGSNAIKADNSEIEVLGLFVDREDIYLDVPEKIVYPFDSHSLLEGTTNIIEQWILHGNGYNLQNTILFQNKLLQVQYIGVPHNLAIRVHDPGLYVTEPPAEDQGNLLTEDNIKNIIGSGSYTSPEINIYCTATFVSNNVFQTKPPTPPFSMACTYIEISNGLNIDSEDEIIIGATVNGFKLPNFIDDEPIFNDIKTTGGLTLWKGAGIQDGDNWEVSAYEIATTYREIDEITNASDLFYIGKYKQGNLPAGGAPEDITYEYLSFGSVNAVFRNLDWNTLSPASASENSKFVLHISGGAYKIYIGFSHLLGGAFTGLTESTSSEQYSLNSVNVHTVHDIKNPLKDDFYANVIGRDTETTEDDDGDITITLHPTAPSAIKHILENELGQSATDIEMPSDNYGWKYAFTIDKKINSKKLIENIASASPFIPRFDNMGNFKFDVIPMDGGGVTSDDHHIKEADVIDFSFSRTKIEDVYTKIVFKYNWDYARDEFNDSVEVSAIMDYGYTDSIYPYYGFGTADDQDAESTLTISDDRGKYFRNNNPTEFLSGTSDSYWADESARAFAGWYLTWHLNQHLKMKIKLPLKYMNLEIGDFVDFDAIIGGVKPYGIDYTDTGAVKVNQQIIYTTFLITSTNKTLEWVEIECIQMHDLDIARLLGCTDETACNYDEYAVINVHSSCEYLDCAGNCPPIGGCPDEFSIVEGCAQIDCCNICGGDSVCLEGDGYCGNCEEGFDLEDECGVCGGDGSSCADCAGVPNGNAEEDICGVCNGTGYFILEEPCVINGDGCYVCPITGTTYGGFDECDEHPGDLIMSQVACNLDCTQSACDCDGNFTDCVGVCGGDAEVDDCGVCGGDGSSCFNCDELTEVELWGVSYNIETTTSINLYNQGLTGSIPPNIGCLKNLTYLGLAYNQLTGIIPQSILYLENLTSLYLGNNQLSGEIPSEIGNLTGLYVLDLANNQLTGVIPESIGNLTNLLNLKLNNNQLSGSIPSPIGNLSNLEQLYLNDNELTGTIPNTICNSDASIRLWNNNLCPNYPSCLTDEEIFGDDGEQDTSGCDTCVAMGDLNGDGGFNILDIVILINCILGITEPCAELPNGCAADLNGDGSYNVIDVVLLANCVLSGNCGE